VQTPCPYRSKDLDEIKSATNLNDITPIGPIFDLSQMSGVPFRRAASPPIAIIAVFSFLARMSGARRWSADATRLTGNRVDRFLPYRRH
jgi:hypothetical protein